MPRTESIPGSNSTFAIALLFDAGVLLDRLRLDSGGNFRGVRYLRVRRGGANGPPGFARGGGDADNNDRNKDKDFLHDSGNLGFSFVNIIDAEEGTCKGCNFAKADEEGFMDLALWLYEDAAEEEDKAAKG